MLASRADYTTLLLKGPRLRSKAGVTEVLQQILPGEPLEHLGLCEFFAAGAVMDVPDLLALKLVDAQVSLLPVWCYLYVECSSIMMRP